MPGAGISAPDDLHILDQLYGSDETAGTYIVGSRASRDPTIVRKYQGEVWTRMANLLRPKNILVKKPRHAAGYAVDAEIIDGERVLLVEIKWSASAADVYAGMGQLLIYRKLLPRLAGHHPVLLLPSLPKDPLVAAILSCGVALYTYKLVDAGGEISVAFSAEFLQFCGLKDVSAGY